MGNNPMTSDGYNNGTSAAASSASPPGPERGRGGDAVGYVATIDGLRCLAVALVLWHHIPYLFDEGLHALPFWRWSHGGGMGVDLFFVISGFLITTILLRTRSVPRPFRTFWLRRAIRIFPLFYLYMAVTCAAIYAFGAFSPTSLYPRSPGALLMFLTYLGNLQIVRTSWHAGEFNILWSLAIEEQFYLVWPVVVFGLNRRSLGQLGLSLLLLAPIFRILATWAIGQRAAYVLPLCHSDGLIMGSILAVLLEDPRHRQRTLAVCRRLAPAAVAGLVFILAGPLRLTDPRNVTAFWLMFAYPLIALLFTLMLGAAVQQGTWSRALLANTPMVYLGRISYGIYLWHWLVADLMLAGLERLAPGPVALPVKVVLWLAATVVVASSSWYLFERPILRLKRRVAYDLSPRTPLTPGTARGSGSGGTYPG